MNSPEVSLTPTALLVNITGPLGHPIWQLDEGKVNPDGLDQGGDAHSVRPCRGLPALPRLGRKPHRHLVLGCHARDRNEGVSLLTASS